MASIEKRGELQYRAVVRKNGFPRYSRTFEQHREAKGWATELEAALGRANFAEVRRLTDDGSGELRTVAALVDRFVTAVVEKPKRRANQVASERPRLARIRTDLGHLPVEMLSSQDVATWRDKRLASGAAPQTVRHDLNQLSVVFATAISEWNLGVRNVVRDVKKPQLPPGRDRRVSAAEIASLHAAAAQVPARGGRAAGRGMGPIITLAVETSMRLGELVSMEWRHIDFQKCIAYLPKTKNGESRTVALSTAAVAALNEMGTVRRIDGRVFDWAKSDSFVGRFASLVRRARAAYEAECERTDIEVDPRFLSELRFHDLRHEATSRLFEKGLNPMEVSSMTGHKSMQMLKRYTHVDAAKVAAKLG